MNAEHQAPFLKVLEYLDGEDFVTRVSVATQVLVEACITSGDDPGAFASTWVRAFMMGVQAYAEETRQ